ncbi:uncharacterized protein LOC100881736 [Megachile rotundata]|uniref:uncharacterized protein LOC100881736 n=1 Tax=Megachile rotundata TaxID=143995 RepID=UPI003FD62146
MPPVNEKNCETPEILKNSHLSNALECNRPCHVGQKPKTCYYKFVLERYPVSGQACNFCTPNITNTLCPNCQCITGNGVERMALVVNRMLPGPSIQVCINDYVVIDVVNKIKEDAVTVHWHGVYQKGTQYYDGVPDLTQCSILYGKTFRYQFPVQNGGTHFWHAHTGLNKMDGVFGSFIVRHTIERDPHAYRYDYDLANHVVVITDWMHEESTERMPGRNSGVVGQAPDSFLINGKGKVLNNNSTGGGGAFEVITVEANKRYRFRLVNSFCATCPGEWTIEGHKMIAIASDGQSMEPVTVDSIVSLPAERYDFILHTNQKPGAYWIQLRGLSQCKNRGIQQLALLQYIDAPTEPKTPQPSYGAISGKVVLNPVDTPCNGSNRNAVCISNLTHAWGTNPRIEEEEPDMKLYMPIGFRIATPSTFYRPNTYKTFLIPGPNSIVMGTMDNIQFSFPPVPPLSQFDDLPSNQFCDSDNLPRGCQGNCTCTHVRKIPLNAVVEVILIDVSNVNGLIHPFHLHGHSFRVLSMGQPLGPYSPQNAITLDYVKKLDSKTNLNRKYDNPAGKDTIALPNNGYAVIRFRANNPGYWLFHCHFIYHHNAGMEMVFKVGEQSDLPPVPKNFPRCGHFIPSINPHYKHRGGKSDRKDDSDEWKHSEESKQEEGRRKREEEKLSIADIGKMFDLW